MKRDMIAVIDFGGQYAHLIARRIREDCNVKTEIFPFDIPADELALHAPSGIILTGGPKSVNDKDAPLPDHGIFGLGVPILGICYGAQVIGKMFGGIVAPAKKKEFGGENLYFKNAPFFEFMASPITAWFSHEDEVAKLPHGFKAIAWTGNCANAAFADAQRNIYAVQFHPEVSHTHSGRVMLANFVKMICGADESWTAGSIADELIAKIKETVGDGEVLCAVSGGVDSFVTAVLLHRAIGDRLHAITVDNGLLRKGDTEHVTRIFKELGVKNFYAIPAEDLFLSRLAGITDPEKKRKTIGRAFYDVFSMFALERLYSYSIRFFAQGTIYPDWIESGRASKHAETIKSHHNAEKLPENFGLALLEPIRELYKDEVRRVGEELGIPHDFLWRHPFPGPGLGVRVIGEITKENTAILREADAIFIEELKKTGEYDRIAQAFAVFLPIKAVGVQGDGRAYGPVIALRAVVTDDFMTARPHEFHFSDLVNIGNRIIREVPEVSRVVYDITEKPPATIEWE
ncbi:glutamine-hydrolyzing GMP synthase [bacterium]|nr:glutamine-hydrolyzing GMP synthase [bacterium]MCI0565882.1 glutamine-hydrolyzing GMP synthase [bacterium]MCI0680252.1 glutamine-hydrolyzing GMP synthase [bacterium]